MIKDILYFGNDWAKEHKTSSHHIAQELSRSRRIFYIESSGLRTPHLQGRDIGKIFRKLKKLFGGVRKSSDNLYVYCLPQLPYQNLSFIKAINRKVALYALRRLIKRFGIKDHILWFIVPQLSFLCGSLGEKLTVYYCVEDYPSFPGINKEYIRKLDEETSKKADIIFVTSQGLLDKKKDLYKSVAYSPHAVDFAHFNKAGRQGPIPEEIKNIKKPVIGMFGLIEERLDLELLKYLACLKPEWSILVIGKVMVDIEGFTGLKNVFFIGHRPYEDLPDYARAFDVSIIAFKQDERVKYINPLKLKEYLAMGKPVVSTPMKEAEKYSDVIEIARTKEEFLGKIELLLKNDTEQMRQKRIKRVENESWESVAAKAIIEAERILTEKSR